MIDTWCFPPKMFGCCEKKPTKKALLSQKTGTKGFGSAVPPKLATEVAHLYNTEMKYLDTVLLVTAKFPAKSTFL
ncbi:hypothetical protein BK723_31550 [Bacillus thuringiensis serovar pondicheriensis]|nr:hypothetical protein BK723_31550 [Bacillus thuringiensis serovar pondicheriensis]